MDFIACALAALLVVASFPSKTVTLAFVQTGSSHHMPLTFDEVQYTTNRIAGLRTPSILFLTNNNQAEDADPDLFDYFDPLLSPHAYPSGISPGQKPQYKSNEEVQQQIQSSIQEDEDSSKGSFGIHLPYMDPQDEKNSSSGTMEESSFRLRDNSESSVPATEEKNGEEDQDLFDYFDPLRSPHDYPDGIEAKKKSISSVTAPSALEIVDDDKESLNSSGVSNVNIHGKKKKVGVLLMDHGSKKEKSNARLQAMAELYQMTMAADEDELDDGTPNIIVRAAHMEIARPSIPDGLKELRDMGVDEIICHPFFLSPGRHVREDIPEIIENAIEDLWGKNSGATPIPIVTTAPVGSNTQLMLGAIHSLVRENSQYLKTSLQNE